jgi:hypothetical protein
VQIEAFLLLLIMDSIIIFSYVSNNFLFIPQSEWDEVKDEGNFVYIKAITYSLQSEVNLTILTMNREIKSVY